jgi:uncharacterized protein YidB (DUF937 family)
MGVLDQELSQVHSRFGISENRVRFLLSDLLSFIDSEDGGVFGFIDRLKRAGLRGWVSSCARGDTKPIDANTVVRALQKSTINKMASLSGLSFSEVAAAIGFLLPKIFHRMVEAEKGMVPSILPSELTSDISGPAASIYLRSEDKFFFFRQGFRQFLGKRRKCLTSPEIYD